MFWSHHEGFPSRMNGVSSLGPSSPPFSTCRHIVWWQSYALVSNLFPHTYLQFHLSLSWAHTSEQGQPRPGETSADERINFTIPFVSETEVYARL